MNTKTIAGILILALIGTCYGTATIERDCSSLIMHRGYNYSISLDITKTNDTVVVGIEESIPDGFNVTNISNNGMVRYGKIEWLLWTYFSPIPSKVTYSLVVPETSRPGVIELEGNQVIGMEDKWPWRALTRETTGDRFIYVL
ncbi:MAG: hypothetical protein WC444_05975 [Candidatus Paceibacterota bacterium]